jgi:hypothetical protein
MRYGQLPATENLFSKSSFLYDFRLKSDLFSKHVLNQKKTLFMKQERCLVLHWFGFLSFERHYWFGFLSFEGYYWFGFLSF